MLYHSPATKLITDVVTFTNARIWEPQIIVDGMLPLYTISIIMPKSMVKTKEGLDLAIQNAIRMGASKHRGPFAKAVQRNLPILDGDNEEFNESFRGCWIINASSFTPPTIVDNQVYPIKDPTLFQPGCKCRVVLDFFSYAKSRKHDGGVGCMLGNIQKAFTRNDYERLPDTEFELCTEHFTRIYLKEAD